MSAVEIVGLVSIAALLGLITYLALHIRTGRREHQARLARLHLHGMTARISKHRSGKSPE